MTKILILAAALFQISIYTIHFNNNAGNDATLAPYSGKKMLIVNIASGSSRAQQLAGLQQLYSQYHDSLEVIAFPSNSFGHEPLNDSAILTFCAGYHITFTLAAKGQVAGGSPQPVFSWLASSAQNGSIDAVPVGDFHKFLIDRNGNLIGSFAPNVQPTDSLLINAITEN